MKQLLQALEWLIDSLVSTFVDLIELLGKSLYKKLIKELGLALVL